MEIVFQVFVCIFVASFVVGVLFLGRVYESHVGDMICYFPFREEPPQKRVLEGVIVRQGHLVDVIVVDERFFISLMRLVIASSH